MFSSVLPNSLTLCMANRMRICLLSREYPPDTGWGGVGAYTYQIAHGLVEIGHDVEVVALAADPGTRGAYTTFEAPDQRIKVHRVEWDDSLQELNLLLVAAPSAHFVIKTTIALWRRFLQLHRERAYDVVEVPEHLAAGLFHAATGAVPLVVKLHTPHSKFVAEQYHGVLPTLDNQLICMWERLTMLLADELCSPSVDLAKFVARDLGVDISRIHPVRNPVDIQRFAPEGERALENDCGKRTVLFVGRLEPRKGVEYLVDAIPSICAKHHDAHFVFVGADTNTATGAKSMLAKLQRSLAGSGCASRVTFVPHVPLARIPAYYRSADVCVVPSLYENAPYTCIEAMACGKPVVTTSAGGSSEYVIHGTSGLVVPPRDTDALAEAISQLLAQPETRTQYGKNARAFVINHLERQQIAREMERLYRQAAERSKNGFKLYKKPAESALSDALELLCATEKMLFDLLYKLSFEFRLKYWLRFLAKRPGLCLATAALNTATALTRFAGREHAPPAFVERLRQKVESKQARKTLWSKLNEQLTGASAEKEHSGNEIHAAAAERMDARKGRSRDAQELRQR